MINAFSLGICIRTGLARMLLWIGMILISLPVQSGPLLVSTNSLARYLVPTNGALGLQWVDPSFDDSGWDMVALPVGTLEGGLPQPSPLWLTDAVADFSGTQGQSQWQFGVYDRSADTNLFYNYRGDFNPTNSHWNFVNGLWQMGTPTDPLDNPPWDLIGPTLWHPNGVANGGNRWAVRRFICPMDGPARIVGMIRHGSSSGDGTVTRIRVDGEEVFSRAVKNESVDFQVSTYLHQGDHVDFMLDPGASGSESSDSSWLQARIVMHSLADSQADWSFSGKQGSHGWFYGYSDRGLDGDSYQASDFFPFSPNLHWTGEAWERVDGAGRRFGLTESGGQGAAAGSGVWGIRRYVSPVNGTLFLGGEASLFGSGDGVTVRVFVDSMEVYMQEVNDLSVSISVTAEVTEGSAIDLIIDPNGTDDGDEGLNLSLTLQEASSIPEVTEGSLLADTWDDWAGTTAQGFNNWYYGFYDLASDGNGVFDPANDFIYVHPDWNFFDGAWRLGQGGDPEANPPWDTVARNFMHPNGEDTGGEHWAIKRWICETNGSLEVQWELRKFTLNGSGVTGMILHNGTIMDSMSIEGMDGEGVTRTVIIRDVQEGDMIDLVLTPEGPSGNRGAGSDGSYISASIREAQIFRDHIKTDIGQDLHGRSTSAYLRIPFQAEQVELIRELTLSMEYDDAFVAYLNGVEVARRNVITQDAGALMADSKSEFSGIQGQDQWYYGYYPKSLDYDGVYHAENDLFLGDPDWVFEGFWQQGIEGEPYLNPPWTSLTAVGGHPNGFNSLDLEEWAVRRYVCEMEGQAVIVWELAKSNPNCGNGITGRILVNGQDFLSRAIEFDDVEGDRGMLVVPGVQPGDLIDFAIDPVGPNGLSVDGCDGTIFMARVFQGEAIDITPEIHAELERSVGEALQQEAISISESRSLLQSGENILAIHGINFSAQDPDFLQSILLEANYDLDLKINRQGDSVTVSWNPLADEQRLQLANGLSESVRWVNYPGQPQLVDGRRTVSFRVGPGERYFRLISE